MGLGLIEVGWGLVFDNSLDMLMVTLNEISQVIRFNFDCKFRLDIQISFKSQQ